MSGMPVPYAAFILVAIATHAVVGYTLGAVLADSPRAGIVGGVIADVDFLFPPALAAPLVHRGITHSFLAAGVSTAGVVGFGTRAALAFGTGYATHLLIDSTTPMGIPIAYPVVTDNLGVLLNLHSAPATAAIWLGCLGLLWYDRR